MLMGIFVLIGMYFSLKFVDDIITKIAKSREIKAKMIIDKKVEEARWEWLRYGFISKKDLHHLDPFEFEKWCGEFLQRLGYRDIEITPDKIDRGKDIVCTKDNEKIYVECKRYDFKENAEFQVTRDVVQKLVGAMVGDKIHKGMIITTGIITDRSREYVSTLPEEYQIKLIDGDELIKMYRELRQQEINSELKAHPQLQ